MLLYIYDSKTFEYLYTTEAQVNPVDGGYFYPSHYTTKAVPAYYTGEIPVFKEDHWIIRVDHRNGLQIELATCKFSIVDYIGDAKQGFQFVTQAEYLDYCNHPERYAVVEGKWINIYGDDPNAEDYSKYSLTKREVFLALYRDKKVTPEMLRSQITDTEALIEFDYAERYYRGNPLIEIIGEKLGYTKEQLDHLFKYGRFESYQAQSSELTVTFEPSGSQESEQQDSSIGQSSASQAEESTSQSSTSQVADTSPVQADVVDVPTIADLPISQLPEIN